MTADHEHEWRDTGFATVEDCDCGAVRSGDTVTTEVHGPSTRVYRTVYLRQRDVDRFPGIDHARLPSTVYSKSNNIDFQRVDLVYLRNEEKVFEAWIETRIEHPWERTDD